jgi:hypothetical protein
MAKNDKKDQYVNDDLFPVTPEIRGLGVQEFKLHDGNVRCTLTGQTLVNDVALLNDETWKKAVAEWLVALCGNGDIVQSYLDEARAQAYAREADQEALRNAVSNVAKFPPGFSAAG